MLYEDYKIYGPYLSKTDNRLRLVLKHKETKKNKVLSYPKYLMEVYLNRYLTENETVDHIDGNPLNNDISNLQVLDRSIHCSLDAQRNKDVLVTCAWCGLPFIIEGSTLHARCRKDRKQSGYFCSRSCTGKYGAAVQNGTVEPFLIAKDAPRVKYQAKSAQDESLVVEGR